MSLIQRQCFVFALCMVPAAWDITADILGVKNAMKMTFHDFGHDAFRLLVLTLCISPLKYLGIRHIVQYRRPLGLACFTYALIHVSLYVGYGKKFDFTRIVQDFFTRTFLIFGLCTFIILVILALTSTSKIQKHLGRSWVKLHQLVYVAMVLACIHYCLAFKVWHIQPFIESFVAFVVLGLRFMF